MPITQINQNLNSWMQNNNHSVTASINHEAGTMQTTQVTGDREGGLFAAQDNMGQMDFLMLLTTQLQFQDPLSPMENTDFVAQLAQFSQLESTTAMQSALEQMAQQFADSMDLQTFNSQSTTNAAAVSLVGKEVRLRQSTFEHNRVELESTGYREFKVHIGERTTGTLHIRDSEGKILRTFTLSDKDETNTVRVRWDGRDNQGNPVGSQTLGLHVEGMDTNDSLYAFVEDVVTGIRYTAQGTMIRVSGVEIPIGDILEVNNTTSSGAANSGSMTMAQALALVGFEASSTRTGNITFEPCPNNSKERFFLDLGGRESATIIVRDTAGNQVYSRRIFQHELNSNDGIAEIERRSYRGHPRYTIEIASDNPNATFVNKGVITGVVNRNGVPTFVMENAIGGGRIYVEANRILSLNAPQNNNNNATA